MPTPRIYESEYSNKYLNTAQNLQRPLKKKNLWPTSYPFLHSDISKATTRCQVLSKHRGHRNKHNWATLCKLNLIKKKKRLIVTKIMRQCNKHSDISIKIWNKYRRVSTCVQDGGKSAGDRNWVEVCAIACLKENAWNAHRLTRVHVHELEEK